MSEINLKSVLHLREGLKNLPKSQKSKILKIFPSEGSIEIPLTRYVQTYSKKLLNKVTGCRDCLSSRYFRPQSCSVATFAKRPTPNPSPCITIPTSKHFKLFTFVYLKLVELPE